MSDSDRWLNSWRRFYHSYGSNQEVNSCFILVIKVEISVVISKVM